MERYKESLYFVWKGEDLQTDVKYVPHTCVNVGDYYTGK